MPIRDKATEAAQNSLTWLQQLASGRHGWLLAILGTIPPLVGLLYLWITEGVPWYLAIPVLIILFAVVGAGVVKSQLCSEGPRDSPHPVVIVQAASATTASGRPSVSTWHSDADEEQVVYAAPTVVAAQVREVKQFAGPGYRHESPWASGFGA
mmetsp:Transcript_46276/g.110107  ORF Transcript_46276/g.110107 Transcript_46276/m.110107 type:complete len:153 (-) Transcript_46276:244-702(-)